jgi:hypothetical protein
MSECGIGNAARPGATALIKWHQTEKPDDWQPFKMIKVKQVWAREGGMFLKPPY